MSFILTGPSRSANRALTSARALELLGASLNGLPVVLVGGQAVNYWADRYQSAAGSLAAEYPYTSEDIDFQGTGAVLAELARRLGVVATIASFDDGCISSGLLWISGDDGACWRVDFLQGVAGVKRQEVIDTSLPASVLGVQDSGFRIMHPVLCLESRAHNVVCIPADYDTAQGLKQLRASIFCADQFVRELCGTVGAKQARDSVERIFRFSLRKTSLILFLKKNIDTFAAAPLLPEFGDRFTERRYPQMCELLRAKRKHAENRLARGML